MIRAFLSLLALGLVALPAAAAPELPASASLTVATGSVPATASAVATGSAVLEQVEDGVTVDWTSFTITVKGLGLAPERGALATRKLLAKRMALSDGYRRMGEQIGLLRVNSEATVNDLLAVDDAARLAVNELIRQARQTDLSYWADGSAEVVLELPLAGNASLSKAVLGTTTLPSGPAKGKVTGLMVDARGTGCQPALSVRLRNSGGNVVAEGLPFAYYAQNTGAKALVGDAALSIKARRAFGPTRADLLLNDDDVRKLNDALKENPKLPLAILR